jgi:hypothetical protein
MEATSKDMLEEEPKYVRPPASSFATLCFPVVKQHHKMTWLKQSRLLLVTGADVRNCKGTNVENAEATKSIEFRFIKKLVLTSKTSFAIYITNDHTYFYVSDKALEIVWAIRKRMSICAAIMKLTRDVDVSEGQVLQLVRSFDNGTFSLPSYASETASSGQITPAPRRNSVGSSSSGGSGGKSSNGGPLKDSTTETERAGVIYGQNMKYRMDVVSAIQSGVMSDVKDAINALVSDVDQTSVELLSISGIRTAMNNLRLDIADLLTDPECRSFKQRNLVVLDDAVAFRVADEALQGLILTRIRPKLWAAMHLQSDLIGMERTFQRQCAKLRMETPESLGFPMDCIYFHYDLVLDHLLKICANNTPHGMLDCISAVCKTIVLTISAASSVGLFRRDTNYHGVEEEGSPAPSPSSADGGGKAADGTETIDKSSRDLDESIRSQKESSPSPRRTSQHPADRKRAATLAADDILPILIYLVVHSGVEDLVYAREWINGMGDPEEATERSYYFTMFSSAVEFILATAEEDEQKKLEEAANASQLDMEGNSSPDMNSLSPLRNATVSRTEKQDDGASSSVGRAESLGVGRRATSISPYSPTALTYLPPSVSSMRFMSVHQHRSNSLSPSTAAEQKSN